MPNTIEGILRGLLKNAYDAGENNYLKTKAIQTAMEEIKGLLPNYRGLDKSMPMSNDFVVRGWNECLDEVLKLFERITE